jgi:hypothetical protein
VRGNANSFFNHGSSVRQLIELIGKEIFGTDSDAPTLLH